MRLTRSQGGRYGVCHDQEEREAGVSVLLLSDGYRFYPTDAQAAELSRTFGCVRLVYNKALAERTAAWNTEQRRLSHTDSSAALTAWKSTEELSFLTEVSSVPLQQTLRHLHTAFRNFFDKRARYPRFESKKTSRASAEYTRSAFRYRDG